MKALIKTYGTGDPVVFIHGAGGSAATWYYQKKHFQPTMATIIAELPGHGASQDGGCNTIEEYGESLFEALKEKGYGRVFLAGHSMGGAIAMSLALSCPEIVRGLILIGTGARLRVIPEILDGIRDDKETTVRNIINLVFSQSAPAAMKESAFNEYMKCRAEVILKDFTACNGFDVLGTIDAITAPTLILCGTDDIMTPIKYSQYLASNIPESLIVLIKGAGHMVMIEKPDELNMAIGEFVRNIR